MRIKCVLLYLVLCIVPLLAQQTPSQVYLAYREAFPKATSLEALQPYLAAQVAAKAAAVPTAERPTVLATLKTLNTAFQVHVIAEMDTVDGTHVMIVDGVDSGDKPIRGTVEMVKEPAGWKLSKETWHGR